MVYEYFDPAFLAGGPIASCANLARLLEDDLDITIFTTNRDLDRKPIAVQADCWVGYGNCRICYANRWWNAMGMYRVLQQRQPDVVYLNGIYSLTGVLVPLLLAYLGVFRGRIVIAPRGMLTPHALAIKGVKKRCYLGLIGFVLKGKRVAWHLTSQEELEQVQQILSLPERTATEVIGNVPRTDLQMRPRQIKSQPVRLLTIALISPMKNTLEIIEALAKVRTPVDFDIYGPVKDAAYWQICQQAIARSPDHVRIRHLGAVARADVQPILEQYDFYIQPSRSENFGHAIFEALAVGLPVITSNATPWAGLAGQKAGYVVDPQKPNELLEAIEAAIEMPQDQYDAYCRNARQCAESYLQATDFRSRYLSLFGAA